MARQVTLFTGQWADLPLSDLVAKAGDFGYDGLELACWGDHLDVDRAATDPDYCAERKELLAAENLGCRAISHHLAGQRPERAAPSRHSSPRCHWTPSTAPSGHPPTRHAARCSPGISTVEPDRAVERPRPAPPRLATDRGAPARRPRLPERLPGHPVGRRLLLSASLSPPAQLGRRQAKRIHQRDHAPVEPVGVL